MLTKIEHNLKTDVPNIHDKYHPNLYKDFVFIEENVNNLKISKQNYWFKCSPRKYKMVHSVSEISNVKTVPKADFLPVFVSLRLFITKLCDLF